MKRSTLLLAVCLAVILAATTCQAATIVLSGDVTPVFSLTDTSPNSENAGNRQFFANVLGSGTNVAVLGTTNNSFAAPEIDEFYDSLGGVTSTLFSGTVTAGDLSGVDLFLAPAPDDAFSAGEVAALQSFLSLGGTAFLMGDAQSIFPASNAIVNNLLSDLGSGLSLVGANLDFGPQSATGGQIANHSLTAGVSEYAYGATSEVGGGDALFFTQNGTPFTAIESAAVPEPTSMALLGLTVLGYGVSRRRRKRGEPVEEAQVV